jgi:hypothetical protein
VPGFSREELGVLKFDNVVLVDAVFCYFRRQGNTQKKIYHIYNTAKILKTMTLVSSDEIKNKCI